MKYICLSFDDSRKDTYSRALPILEKYKLKGTVNVISKFVLNNLSQNLQEFNFKSSKLPMSIDELLDWESKGHEIACHGRTHQNTEKDILENIEDLKKMGICIKNLGFASPRSELTLEQLEKTGLYKLYQNKNILYFRSGVQVRREGIIYFLLSILEKVTHSKVLFKKLQIKNIMSTEKLPLLLKSVAIKNYTTTDQIKYLINVMKDNESLILMFHSILNKNDEGYKKDSWYWDEEAFEELCRYLSENREILNLTTKELVIKKI